MRRLMTVGALAVTAALLPMAPVGALPQGYCPRNAEPLFDPADPADRNGDGTVCVVSLPTGEPVAVVDNGALPNGVPPKMRH